MRKIRRLPLLFRLILLILLIGLICYLLLVGMVIWKEHHVPQAASWDEVDAIVVLGAQVKPDGTPNLQLQWRLDKAFEVWQAHACPIVVCGAQGADEPKPEATVMTEYLISLGVPEDMILADPASFNTRENIRHAAELLKGRSIRTILIVTSDYHLPRAIAIASDEGMHAVGIASRTLQGFYWVKNHFREALAWVKYWGQKYLHLAW